MAKLAPIKISGKFVYFSEKNAEVELPENSSFFSRIISRGTQKSYSHKVIKYGHIFTYFSVRSYFEKYAINVLVFTICAHKALKIQIQNCQAPN